jgi:hypothetical protein
MKLRIIFSVLIAISVVLIFSCKSGKQATKWQIAPTEYAFVEYYQVNDGKVLEGEASPGRRIDGPTYSFNPETNEVMSFVNLKIEKDSLLLLIGRGLVLRGTQGGGMHSRLIEAKGLPIVDGKLIISKLTEKGLYITWNATNIILNPGDVWENTTSKIDTLDSFNGRAVVENTTTYTIKFHGFFQKEKLSVY